MRKWYSCCFTAKKFFDDKAIKRNQPRIDIRLKVKTKIIYIKYKIDYSKKINYWYDILSIYPEFYFLFFKYSFLIVLLFLQTSIVLTFNKRYQYVILVVNFKENKGNVA